MFTSASLFCHHHHVRNTGYIDISFHHRYYYCDCLATHLALTLTLPWVWWVFLVFLSANPWRALTSAQRHQINNPADCLLPKTRFLLHGEKFTSKSRQNVNGVTTLKKQSCNKWSLFSLRYDIYPSVHIMVRQECNACILLCHWAVLMLLYKPLNL